MPCHHALGGALRAYINAVGIAEQPQLLAVSHRPRALFPIWPWPSRMDPAGGPRAWRRKSAAKTFRATGIAAYLANGGALERAREMAVHEGPRTTKLHGRTNERLTQDEVEKIGL